MNNEKLIESFFGTGKMEKPGEPDMLYVNIYEDISTGTLSVSRRYHPTSGTAKQAAKGTCSSGRKRNVARIRAEYRPGQFDD